MPVDKQKFDILRLFAVGCALLGCFNFSPSHPLPKQQPPIAITSEPSPPEIARMNRAFSQARNYHMIVSYGLTRVLED